MLGGDDNDNDEHRCSNTILTRGGLDANDDGMMTRTKLEGKMDHNKVG